MQRLQEVLLAENVNCILERLWSMNKGYVMGCKE